jgi:hypothetical protein
MNARTSFKLPTPEQRWFFGRIAQVPEARRCNFAEKKSANHVMVTGGWPTVVIATWWYAINQAGAVTGRHHYGNGETEVVLFLIKHGGCSGYAI